MGKIVFPGFYFDLSIPILLMLFFFLVMLIYFEFEFNFYIPAHLLHHVPFPQLLSESERVCELLKAMWEMGMSGQGVEALLYVAEFILPTAPAPQASLASLPVPPPLPIEGVFFCQPLAIPIRST